MADVARVVKGLVAGDDAQDLIEYAFLATAIALATYTVIQNLGTGLSSQFDNINDSVTGGGRGR